MGKEMIKKKITVTKNFFSAKLLVILLLFKVHLLIFFGKHKSGKFHNINAYLRSTAKQFT